MSDIILRVGGMLIPVLTGVIIPWISKKAVNYRKINKEILISSLLYTWHFMWIQFVVAFVGIVIISVGITLFGEITTLFGAILIYVMMAVIALFLLWLILRKSKRMKVLMAKIKEMGKVFHFLIHFCAIVSMIIAFVYLLVHDSGDYASMTREVISLLSWAFSIWWFCLIAMLIWKTSDYVYSNMKITMLNDEVIECGCHPKMYRVHRNYVRILQRDEKGVVTSEKQINEIAIKKIEYFK